jgi:hypothetical protein
VASVDSNENDLPESGKNEPVTPDLNSETNDELAITEGAYPPSVLPSATTSRAVSLAMMVNPTVMQSLAREAPDRVLDFAEASDERQYRY